MKLNFFIFIYLLIFKLATWQSANAMFKDEDGEEIERAAWKKYVYCCQPPSKKEKAIHYYQKGVRLEKLEEYDKALIALEISDEFGHHDAERRANAVQEIISVKPWRKSKYKNY